MRLTDISKDINEWFKGTGPSSDVVISSRIRLARNLAGYKFLNRCTGEERKEILEKLKNVLMSLNLGEKVSYVSVDQASSLDRNFLVERHLISRNHAYGKGPRGVVVANREFFAAMINEEDHLRMQILKGGLQLGKCIEQIGQIDDVIESKLDYAFSPRYGYLTACPTNVGTGIRVSVMLHLPALKMTNQIEKFFRSAKKMNLVVRGLFGEGTDAAGDFYQLSNQVTLGVSGHNIVDQFENEIIPEVVRYEHDAREHLLSKKRDTLDDKIYRAMALLKNARLISSQEALFLLSHLRLGLNLCHNRGACTPAIDSLLRLRRSKGDEKNSSLSIPTINRLFMLTLPAHLQINYGKSLDSSHRDALRAQIIRSALNPD